MIHVFFESCYNYTTIARYEKHKQGCIYPHHFSRKQRIQFLPRKIRFQLVFKTNRRFMEYRFYIEQYKKLQFYTNGLVIKSARRYAVNHSFISKVKISIWKQYSVGLRKMYQFYSNLLYSTKSRLDESDIKKTDGMCSNKRFD